MNNKNIDLYNTHIEIYPYILGESKTLENRLSRVQYFKYKPMEYIPMCFHYENYKLYIPRGIDVDMLVKLFPTATVSVIKETQRFDYIDNKYSMTVKPKSRMQEEGIEFLSGEKEFAYTKGYHQLSLNLDTGDGKTVAAIAAILKLKMKAIIITHQTKIKNQWIKSIEEKTDIDMERVCDIKGTEVIDILFEDKYPEYDIYLVNHQSLASYARNHNWEDITKLFSHIRVGIKIIDETHIFFENSLMIDYYTNVEKSFYVTATFTRSSVSEIKLFNKAYSSAVKYGESTFDYEEKRKHIVFVVVYFKSNYGYKFPVLRSQYGFSSYKYIDYELSERYNSLINVLNKILDDVERLDGKIEILSPKTESVDIVKEELIRRGISEDDIGVIYGKNKNDVNEEAKTKRYISSTIKSAGTGTDIEGLRVLINLEPIGSKLVADQVRGRLREYSKDKDTYLFYPVDVSISDCKRLLKNILPIMTKKCKEIHFITYE